MPVGLDAPAEKLSQGDVFAEVPIVYVRSLAYMVKVDKNTFTLRQRAPEALDARNEHQANVREASSHTDPEDPFGNAMGVRRFGVVLTHDCEIDKMVDRPSVLVALVRELGTVHEEHRAAIRSYAEKRTFYLPASEFLPTESFVDLRVVSTIRREQLETLHRVASMNEDGRMALRAQLFRFFVRRTLPPDWPSWPEDPEIEHES